MGQALWENPTPCHQVCRADHSPARAAAFVFLRKATWTPLDYKATSSHHLEMTHEAQPSPHKTAQPLSPACLPSGPSRTVMSTLPPQGPGASFPVKFPSLTLDMKTCGDPFTTTQLLGIPVASSGYLHPVQRLETGLSCLPYPTLFLLRSRLALSLPSALLLLPQWKNYWLPARGRAAHREVFLHGTSHLCSGVPVPGRLSTGSVTSEVVRLVFFFFLTCFSNLMSLKARHDTAQTGRPGTVLALLLGWMGPAQDGM